MQPFGDGDDRFHWALEKGWIDIFTPCIEKWELLVKGKEETPPQYFSAPPDTGEDKKAIKALKLLRSASIVAALIMGRDGVNSATSLPSFKDAEDAQLQASKMTTEYIEAVLEYLLTRRAEEEWARAMTAPPIPIKEEFAPVEDGLVEDTFPLPPAIIVQDEDYEDEQDEEDESRGCAVS